MAYATDYTTLLTGSYWSGAEVTAPVFVTYSFDTTSQTADDGQLASSALATFTPFTAAQQAEAQQALSEWSSTSTTVGGGSGIIFLEVPSGQGDINFAAYDFASDPNFSGAGGEGFYPWGNWNYSTAAPGTIHFAADNPGSGDILMNTAYETGGLFSYPTLLHEIGHAIGLKHPTEAWTNYVDGDAIVHNLWPASPPYQNSFSIMSAGGDDAGGAGATDLTAADIEAVQSIYGTPAQAAEQDASWSWNATTDTLTQVLKSGPQTVRGISTNNIIRAGSGTDAIYAVGAGVNAVYGGSGDDTLVGGSGSNTLYAGTGPDIFNGWFGVTYVSYAHASAAVVANLLNPAANTGEAAGDTYLAINRLIGSNFGDTLVANNNGDVLIGGAGNDTLISGTGDNTLNGGGGINTAVYDGLVTITENAAGNGWSVAHDGGSRDTLKNLDIVEEGAGPEVILVGASGFATIQDAVDAAAAGDIIEVAGGTYADDVNVTLGALTIKSASGKTVTNSGAVTTSVGDRVTFTGADNVFTGAFEGAGTVAFTGGSDALSGVTLSAASLIINTPTVTLGGTIDLTSTLTATTKDLIIAPTGATLSGGGILMLTNLTTNTVVGTAAGATLTNDDKIKGAGQLGDGSMTLDNAAGALIEGTGSVALTINTGAATTIINAGTIQADGAGGVTISSPLDNTGLLVANLGTLIVAGALTGNGHVNINGGTADFTGAFNENVDFTGTKGVLELAASQAYSGKLTGLSPTGSNALDLDDIDFADAPTWSYSGTAASGVLSIGDSAGHTARITLEGDYLGQNFILSAGPGSGTSVVDPGNVPPASPLVSMTSTHRFVAIAASFAASVRDAGRSEAWRGPPPMLAIALGHDP